MKVFVVNFENDVALEGLLFIKESLPLIEVTGLLARNIHPSVYASYSELPIFEKKIELHQLLDLRSECEISLDLIEFLIPHEEQMHYHINRYFETGLAYDYSLLKYKLILYVLEMFSAASGTEVVYFGVTPHDPVSYLVYLVAKFKQIEVLIIDKAHWLNGYVLYKEIGKRASSVLSSPIKSNQEAAATDIEIIQSSLKSLLNIEPHYMGKQRKQFGSLYKKLCTSVFVKKRLSLVGFLRYKEKQNEKADYASLVKINSEQDLITQNDKLIFFPLHYQPELTTSPDGGIYSQQWLAIKHLVEQLPVGFKVLVKEHPSQFLLNTKQVRSRSFYKGILSISSKVEFVGLNLDSKQVLKYSSGVITITGTIGLEALLREKPVLYFGDAIFGGITGTYGTNQIDEFIDHIIQNKIIKREDALNDFNRFGESVFFSGIAPNSKHPASHFEATEVLFKAFLRLL